MGAFTRNDMLMIKLRALGDECRRLDAEVTERDAASLETQRLKRRRSALQEEIAALRDQITPDIIA